MSPITLFTNLCLDDAIRQWILEGLGIYSTHERVSTLLFTDEQILLVESENEL